MVKKCKKCGESKPATLEFFYAVKGNRDGLNGTCKVCHNAICKVWQEENKERFLANGKAWREANPDKMKELRVSWRETNKEHMKEYGKSYRENNVDKERIRHKIYGESNKEKIAVTSKLWAVKNKERIAVTSKNWREENRDRMNTLCRNWRKENPDKQIITLHKYRSRKKKLPNTLTDKQWEFCQTKFDKCCAYCGNNAKLTVEHFIPVSKSGELTINNIIPICKRCNSSKNNKDFFDWYPKQFFYNKKREQKILKYLNYDIKTRIQQLALI